MSYNRQRIELHHQLFLASGLLVAMTGLFPFWAICPLFLACAVLLADSVFPHAPLCNRVLDITEGATKELASYAESLQDRKVANVENRALSFAENSRMNDHSISTAKMNA